MENKGWLHRQMQKAADTVNSLPEWMHKNETVKQIKIDYWWWEDEKTFCFRDKETKEIWKCENTYLKDIKFKVEGSDELDSNDSEMCTIELTHSYK